MRSDKPVEIHDAANLFPMMSAEEFRGLVEDIRENGQLEPVVFWKDQLIDGRNRWKACQELGIDVLTSEVDDETDPLKWVVSHNLHRRHLNESQRAMVATKYATLKHGQAGNGRKVETSKDVSTIDAAAKLLNVSTASVDRAKKVVASGAKAVVDLVEAGELPVAVAEKFVKSVPDKREQAKIASAGMEAVRKAVSPVKPAKKSCDERPKREPEKTRVPETSYFAEFKQLWDRADATGRHAIMVFVMDQWNGASP